jgi:hypothetical protein
MRYKLLILIYTQFFLTIKSLLPRNIKIQGRIFIKYSGKEKGEQIILTGPNIVVKGPPYLPMVIGNEICNDIINQDCLLKGNCISCTTFNEADIKNIINNGWNTIRLGVVWAGAQPKDENKLDEKFVENLHKILNLTDFFKINVILDNHGDMVGSQGCGNGVPTWLQKKAAGELFGKPLETNFPYNLFFNVKKLPMYSECGNNSTKWEKFSGDPNYNLLNNCCKLLNEPGNPGELGFTTISQKTMNFIFSKKEGRNDFCRFWRLLSEAVKDYPSAFMAELMNEPSYIYRKDLFETWKECSIEIIKIIPDMSISLSETFQGSFIPSWLTSAFPFFRISKETELYIKKNKNFVYAFHWYGTPKSIENTLNDAIEIGKAWDVPIFATEFGDCEFWKETRKRNISTTYWHYSSYCNTGIYFANRKVPEETFGACILGWGGGNSSNFCKNLNSKNLFDKEIYKFLLKKKENEKYLKEKNIKKINLK